MSNVKKYGMFGLILIALTLASAQNNSSKHKVNSVIVKGVEVEYETFGEGKPVVMIHGFGVDRELLKGCMEPTFTNLRGWKRIYFDLPGMGKTPVPKELQNTDQMLGFVSEFIEKVVRNEHYVIVGNSYGGYLARGLLYTQPINIDGFLLICPLNIADQYARKLPEQIVVYRDTVFYGTLNQQDKQIIDDLLTSQTENSWKRVENEIFPSFLKRNEEFLDRFSSPANYKITYNQNKINPFEKPALILTGRQDHTVGYKDVWTYLDTFPRATFAVLDMASHNLQIEQAQIFNSLVNDLFDRIEKFHK
jgi:pimeloyl-ACP methyl ester carboxylesterase